MLRTILLLTLACLASGGDRASDRDDSARVATERAKRQAERVMNAGLPFAERTLAEHGEFAPFGAVMLADGLIQNLLPPDDLQPPSAEEIYSKLSDGLKAGAAASRFRVVATFVLVELPDPEGGDPTRAVHVALEHHDGYCVDVFYPTLLEGDRVVLGEAFAAKRAGVFFDACE